MHGIDGNEAESKIFVKILVCRNVATPLLQAKLHFNLPAFADGRNVNILIQDLNIAVSFDHSAGDNTRLISAQIDHLRRVPGKLERDLLQVKNNVCGIFDDTGNRLKLVQHTFDLDRGDRCSLNRRKQYPPQRIANGGAESALERLRPEVTILVSQRFRVHRQALRFLKTLPEHSFLLFLRSVWHRGELAPQADLVRDRVMRHGVKSRAAVIRLLDNSEMHPAASAP